MTKFGIGNDVLSDSNSDNDITMNEPTGSYNISTIDSVNNVTHDEIPSNVNKYISNNVHDVNDTISMHINNITNVSNLFDNAMQTNITTSDEGDGI